MPGVQEPPEAEAPRKYGAYQAQIYADGLLRNILPTVTTDPNKLEEQAKKALGSRSYNYVAGGAGERATMDANRLAFRQWKMIPRMLRPTTHRDLRIEIFGEVYDSPLFVAPVGVQTIFHQDKELGVAEIATELGVPYILSTASSSSIEDVAKASGNGHRWFQLYWPQDDRITLSLLDRAKKAGYKVLVVTLDTWALSWRPWDLDNAYVPFASGIGDQTGFSDPAFRAIFKEDNDGKEVEEDVFGASRAWEADVFSGAAHTWDQLELLKKNWEGPIVLKGIQHVEDAKKALEVGVQGIVVSNHGGRQLDGAIGSLEVLPEIVEAVGNKMTVLFDSGVRTGVDVIKALCLGAKGVLIGRPFVYGLAIGGKNGAKSALKNILADLDNSMGLAGIRTVKDCDRSMIRRVQYGGDTNSSN
ncbi:MAG: hypothetical protein M1830_008804 [Pleopsidium flavum]|nr:MAG: hypothetical protein M1830_008804 [Pleopsidium flavum]